MAEFGKSLRKALNPKEVWLPILVVSSFICLRWLFNTNMGLFNEANLLVFARQQVDPGWIPNDWYLNESPSYRILFISFFGTLAAKFGFLATSIIGRLICYTFTASALVFLSKKLRLNLIMLLLALTLFLYVNTGLSGVAGDEGAVAREWMIGGVEPKMPAYGLILYGIGFLLSGQLLPAALMLGVATSFHTLVGGWATLSALIWVVGRHPRWLTDWRRVGLAAVCYLVTAATAIPAVIQQLTTEAPEGLFPPSFTYVYLRTPHHLNPLSWDWYWWIKPLILLTLLLGSAVLLARRSPATTQSDLEVREFRLRLATFTLVSLIPFGFGLIAAPFDVEGKFLQYYPFRFGDIMLPLNTCLLVSCAAQQLFDQGRSRKILHYVCLGGLALTIILQSFTTTYQIQGLIRQFPGKPQEVISEARDLSAWIRTNTPKDAMFVSSPVDLLNFNWLTERATIAKFKLVPPSSSGIAEWLQRVTDLSGDVDPWKGIKRTQDNYEYASLRMEKGYRQMNDERAIALMNKYKADYWVAPSWNQIHTLPIAYQNARYVLYTRPDTVKGNPEG